MTAAPCCICQGSTFLMFTIAGSKRTGVQPACVCSRCWRKWKNYEVDLPDTERG